jgi:hypothetical protein
MNTTIARRLIMIGLVILVILIGVFAVNEWMYDSPQLDFLGEDAGEIQTPPAQSD